MSRQTAARQTQQQQADTASSSGGVLQRQCACGQHTIVGGECAECRKNRLSWSGPTSQPTGGSDAPAADSAVWSPHSYSFDSAAGTVTQSLSENASGRGAAQNALPAIAQPGFRTRRPGDTYLWQAERIARPAMRRNGRGFHGVSTNASMIHRKPLVAGNGRFSIPPEILETIRRKLGKGRPLETSVRLQMEALLGGDLSQVGIHTGAEAHVITQALRAEALSVWQDIFFSEGAYDPGSTEGQKLLAHELAHVLRRAQEGVSGPDLPLEVVTDQVEESIAESAEREVVETEPREEAEPAEDKVATDEATFPEQKPGTPVPESEPPEAISQTPPGPGQTPATAEAPSTAPDLEETLQAQTGPQPETEVSESASDTGPTEEPQADEAAEAPVEKAPEKPEEDPAYQAVVEQVKTKARREKTPPSASRSQDSKAADGNFKRVIHAASEKKEGETGSAALLPQKDSIEQASKINHLKHLDQTQQEMPQFTPEGFMAEYKKATDALADKLPKNRDENSNLVKAFEFQGEKTAAKQKVVEQHKPHADSLRDAVAQDPSTLPGSPGQAPEPPELEPDPTGATPTIKDANTAAPKPRPDDDVSLDDQSRALDDALLNHNVNGQVINVKEESLAFPVSGEETFDEAAAAKREAQDELEKARPRYREEEAKFIAGSQAEMHSLVKTGLGDIHNPRSGSFGEVLDIQQDKKDEIVTQKQAALNTFRKIYKDTTEKVNAELETLNGIEGDFEKIITETENEFRDSIFKQLEYIYTPGFFDYSDWIDKSEVQRRINEEYDKILRKGEGNPLVARSIATRIVQDEYAEQRFENTKNWFIGEVTNRVRTEIAPTVAEALNEAKRHIQEGLAKTEEQFKLLDPKVQEAVQTAYEAVKIQYETLEETVEGRQSEIIGDMARTYNQSVGKLRSTFDTIKKDVLTSWFEKAWNKVKAVVEAVIEFASRIAALLGRLAHLVDDIISSPRYFFNNLVTGIGQGFSTFVTQIDEFLSEAFFDWLRGSSGLPIQLPQDWGPGGIFDLFTQLLGLSTETIWERMEIVYDETIANAFRRGEGLLEQGLEVFRIARTEGIGGLWDYIKESLGNILEETLDTIKETVLYAAIERVIKEIGKLIVPGGGFIAIAEKVIRLLQFIVEARNKILDLIESFVDSVELAVKGDIPGIVERITSALTSFITLAIDFLVSFFGLRSLKDKVQRFIERMRRPVIRGIDWVLNKFKPVVYRVYERIAGRRPGAEEDRDLEDREEVAEATREEEARRAAEEPGPEKIAKPDFASARRLVRNALDTQLPQGAREVADVGNVLSSVAPRVKLALTNLHAEEFQPGRPKEEGAIGFTVRANTQSKSNAVIAMVRQSKKREVTQDEIRIRALTALRRGLPGTYTRAEAEAILKRLGDRLQADGVRYFELGPESEEERMTIYMRVNPLLPLDDLVKQAESKPAGRSVIAAIELTIAQPMTVEAGAIPAVGEKARVPYGGEVLRQPASETVQVLTWNTSDIDPPGNDSHAEHQFVQWLMAEEQKDLMRSILKIVIRMKYRSPCSQCSPELEGLLKAIEKEQHNESTKIKEAHIYWTQLHSSGAQPTSWQNLRELREAGWTLHAPKDKWPPEESGETRGRLIYEGATWRLEPSEAQPPRRPSVIRRRQGEQKVLK